MSMNFKRNIVALVLALVAAGLWAQAKPILTVNASEGPAQVMLSGKLIGIANPKFVGRVSPGTYELVVRKTGRPEFRQRITIGTADLTINAQLGGAAAQTLPAPQTIPAPQVIKPLYTLSVSANAPNAQVTINGSALGTAPVKANLEAGSYRIEVSAQGYEPYAVTVAVNGNTNHAAALKQQVSQIVISANVSGAAVIINNVQAGKTPFETRLAPGSYQLRVSAPGYNDYSAGFVVSGPQTITVSLIPMMATLRLNVADQFANRDTGNPAARVDLYVDGNKQNPGDVQLTPGQHVLRIVSGGLAVETNVSLEAGRTYTIEPTLGIGIR